VISRSYKGRQHDGPPIAPYTVRLDGGKLRALREAHGLSLRALGDQIGRTAQFISMLEHEQHIPSLATCDALLEVFGDELAEAVEVQR
jgi:transcriptional regulator with XRE-family HTH domain